jgi:beta-mannosidase
MKRIPLFFLFLTISFANIFASPVRKNLDENWQFKQVRGYNWYPATVPGVVQTDLLDNKMIDDPFFRLNEREMQWIDKEDWLYTTTFDTDESLLRKENIILRFEGLDTYADVSLNGRKILSANNMFREWNVDVKALLKAKDNKLEVYFHSPVKIAMPQWEALPFHYHASNDQSENGGLLDRQLSVFVRKAGYHFGWDWGPRLVTSGIWRPVYLEAWDEARIQDAYYRTISATTNKASIETLVEIVSDRDAPAAVSIRNNTDQREAVKKTINLKKGLNKITLAFDLKKPKLWWTNGLGEPFLYDFSTQLTLNDKETDRKDQKFGVRSLKVVMQPDQYGESFYFELNGSPVFAKGANYIPCDNFLTRVTDSIYEKTILDAVNANMNMLRVWGGGIYENNYFYDLCDKYGILIWQDFMFACSMYPAEGDFLENIRLEAVDNVRRLRNHSSIALWCGNNECLDAWFGWGWKPSIDKLNPAYSDLIWKQFKDQYFVTLPAVVEEYQPGTCYRKTSPYSDDQGTRNHTVGDMHYWTVWQGMGPLSDFSKEKSRFFSEYGFQSFPEFESIRKYAPESSDWQISSEVMMSHQRGGMNANNRINEFLLKEYRKPKDFESFIYMSQLLQGDAMKIAMESHRRDMPYCMGSLYWQHNDCWPVASWSSRDYYGRWKAQHYFAVKAYDDLLITSFEDAGELRLYAVSDRLKSTSGTLSVEVIDLNKGLVANRDIKINVPANTSTLVWKAHTDQFLNGLKREDVVVHVSYKDKSGKVYENNFFPAMHKDLHYQKVQITRTFIPVTGGYELTLTADKFARGVFISLGGKDEFISDNYVDLLPGKSVTLKVTTKIGPAEFEKNLHVISFVDAASSED